MTEVSADGHAAANPVSFPEALRLWWRIGLLSFGGPAGQIALMHRLLVEEKRWIDEARFLHALNYCMLLPGPEAQQLATYIGWLLHGVRGGLVAGLLFILPGALAIFALSFIYVLLGQVAVVEGLFFGLKAAVLALVLQALLRLAQRTLHGALALGTAAASFLALVVLDAPFPLVVLSAAALGLLTSGRWAPAAHGSETAVLPDPKRPGTLRAAVSCVLLWLGTVAGLLWLLGGGHVFTQIAVFFSQMALISFGGAYAVLAWVAQQGVEGYGWLQPGEMLDGLGLAETTPGPLILVTQFVGFLAGLRGETGLPPLLAAALAGALTTWVTFLPSFVWIFAGAPYIERLRGQTRLASALSAITAAVVGVIASLALWFAFNSLFAERVRVEAGPIELLLPVASSLQPLAAAVAAIAVLLVFRMKLGVFPLLGFCAGLGILLRLLGWV
ncbi:MAG: chromate efflux transporter [Aquimonas sp.]|nr:chromate efflux transporter [Aquimonas sp.]